jgi:hypothetical protein
MSIMANSRCARRSDVIRAAMAAVINRDRGQLRFGVTRLDDGMTHLRGDRFIGWLDQSGIVAGLLLVIMMTGASISPKSRPEADRRWSDSVNSYEQRGLKH